MQIIILVKRKLYFILSLIYFSQLCADQIVVNNLTDQNLYVAIYYSKDQNVDRSGDIYQIPSGTAKEIERPERKFLYDRNLAAATKENELSPHLSFQEFQNKFHLSVGTLKGDSFYIIKNDKGELEGFNSLEWKIRPIKAAFNTPPVFAFAGFVPGLDPALRIFRQQYLRHPFTDKKAAIRQSIDIPVEEKNFRATRSPRIKKSLEQMLNMTLNNNEVPHIAFCGSGGGHRAMIATLGSLIGADSFGLLNSAMYISGLSGSTWFIAPWIESGIKSLEDYRRILPQRTYEDLFHGKINTNQISSALTLKMGFNQPLSLIDIYGALLAEKLLGFSNDPQGIYLIDQINKISGGEYPYPIYTAVLAISPYEWFEFTPYEVGSIYLKSFVPGWAFGHFFNNGQTVYNIEPPLSLGFMMGVWGSAFSANFREILEHEGDKINPVELRNLLKIAVAKPTIGETRISTAVVYNFTFNVPDLPLNTYEKITLVDAGLDFNIPTPPLLRPERTVDIIIVLDASGNVAGAPALHKAEEYAKRHGLKFPKINYENIDKTICSIFQSADPSIPTIIYFPLIKNERYGSFDPAESIKTSYAKTYNFKYSAEQINELSGLTEFSMKENKDRIIEAIKHVVNGKKKRKS